MTMSTVSEIAPRVSPAKVATKKLPLDTRFTLGASITAEQRAFLDEHGFLVFAKVAKLGRGRDDHERLIDRLEAMWIAEDRKSVRGIPLFWGKNAGKPFLQRFPFTSTFSPDIQGVRSRRAVRADPRSRRLGRARRRRRERRRRHQPLHQRARQHSSAPRLAHRRPSRSLLPPHAEADAQHRASLGSLHRRQRRPPPHPRQPWPRQGFWLYDVSFRKPYFVSHAADANEVTVETEPGDLTVHDGRLWHRVAVSTRTGPASLRRSMYVPYLTDPYEPKSEQSKMPLYHRLGAAIRKLKTMRR